jgi:hypothetical protein
MNEASGVVVVRTFTSVSEAHVARSVLDAAGIPTPLANDNFIPADWLSSRAADGVKLLVPVARASEAIRFLETPVDRIDGLGSGQEGAARDEASPARCSQCGGDDFERTTHGSIAVFLLTGFLLGVPLRRVPVLRYRQCGISVETRW